MKKYSLLINLLMHITILISLCSFFNCEDSKTNVQGDDSNMSSIYLEQGGLSYYLETDRASYSLGGKVKILYRITNISNNTIEVGDWPNLMAACPIYIEQNGSDIWKMPAAPYAITNYYLAPDEYCEVTWEWNMMELVFIGPNIPVGAGTYTAVAEMWPTPSQEIKLNFKIK